MSKGKHRAARPNRRGVRALQITAASCLLAGGGLLPTAGTATADVTPSVPISYALFQLPPLGTVGTIDLSPVTDAAQAAEQAVVGSLVYLPSINGGGESCFETADTGWVCTPVVSDSLAAHESLTSEIDFLPPGDMQLTDPVPDPNAPVPVPDVTVEQPDPTTLDLTLDQQPGSGGSGAPLCSSYGYAIWDNSAKDQACPPVHWYKGYYYVNNTAASRWPVKNYTSYWTSNVGGLTVGYGCPSSSHCVKVVSGKYGDVPWVGETVWTYDAHNRFVSMSMRFNDSYSGSSADYSQAACHELGHADGLGHEQRQAGCMSTPVSGKTTATSDDFNQLYYHTYAPGLPT
ncbi:MAG: hypothetical protein QOD07_144, partial [Frankiaceae bacterium]|nr:hypothetical protein [Frankiaceae bacterium]